MYTPTDHPTTTRHAQGEGREGEGHTRWGLGKAGSMSESQCTKLALFRGMGGGMGSSHSHKAHHQQRQMPCHHPRLPHSVPVSAMVEAGGEGV